jgi:p-aminobenzoyl-glutamate transporter AbgT
MTKIIYLSIAIKRIIYAVINTCNIMCPILHYCSVIVLFLRWLESNTPLGCLCLILVCSD